MDLGYPGFKNFQSVHSSAVVPISVVNGKVVIEWGEKGKFQFLRIIEGIRD